MPSDLDIMRRHVGALFTHDDNGRLRRVNELNGDEASRFFLGRTTAGNIWRFRHDLPETLTRDLEAVCLREPVTGSEKPAYFTEYMKLLEAHSPVEKIWMGPAYLFADMSRQPSTAAVIVTSENTDILRGGFEDWIPDVPLSQ